jgi:hypothetical protein
MTAEPDRSYSTSAGTRLRWGTGLESVGDQLLLHCTDRNYGKGCDINTFAARRRSADRALRRSTGASARRRKTAVRKCGARKAAKQPRKAKRSSTKST